MGVFNAYNNDRLIKLEKGCKNITHALFDLSITFSFGNEIKFLVAS